MHTYMPFIGLQLIYFICITLNFHAELRQTQGNQGASSQCQLYRPRNGDKEDGLTCFTAPLKQQFSACVSSHPRLIPVKLKSLLLLY